MPKLVCQSGPTAGHEYALTKDVTILGRQSSCDVQIPDDMSSRAQCQIRRDGRLYSLVDLGSRNGTLLNGKKVSERLLSFGDVIRIGKVEYLLVKEPKDLELKDLLSKYEIQEKIGEGGMGIVYKANQRSMARVVALKILSPKYSSKTKFVEQFTREARAAGSLNHPNIIQVHDVGAENDIHYFSMEFVDGPTCMQVLRSQGPFPVADAMEIVRQTARALEYAHSHRLIHQDIKPDNIMLGPNNIVKLADLGISKTFDEVEADDGNKKVMGTPHYMAPEAALGKKVDHRVDIYSLGATAYHLLCGKTPYQGTSPTEVLRHHVMDPLPPITEINPAVPPKVVALIERMMAKKPEDRLQSATEVVEEIRQAVGSESTAAPVGGETMILRRYAKGGPTAASVPTPASLTTGSRTPGGENTTPGEGNDRLAAEVRLRLLSRVMVAGIVIVGFAVIGYIATHLFGSPAKTQNAAPSPAPVAVQPQPQPGPGQAQGDPPQDPHAADQERLGQGLTRLEQELEAARTDSDTDAFRQELEKITNEQLNPDNLARAKRIGARIEEMLARRRTEQIEAEFSALSKDVAAFTLSHDYDTALSRMDAFGQRHEASIKTEFDQLRAQTLQAKEDFHTQMKAMIDEAYTDQSEAELKDLRDTKLPRAYLGSDLEKEITKDIDTLERHNQAEMDKTVKEGQSLLSDWHFDEFEAEYRANHAQLNGQAANRYDAYHDAVGKFSAMVKMLSTKLSSGQQRFHGSLRSFDEPDLTKATLDEGITLNSQVGGEVTLLWLSLSPEEVRQVLEQVLGKESENLYMPAVKLLWELKPPPQGKPAGK